MPDDFVARWGERANTNPLLLEAQKQYAAVQALRAAAPASAGGITAPSTESVFAPQMEQSRVRALDYTNRKAAEEALKAELLRQQMLAQQMQYRRPWNPMLSGGDASDSGGGHGANPGGEGDGSGDGGASGAGDGGGAAW